MPPRFSRLWRSSAARGSPPSWPRGRRRPFHPNPRRAASPCSKGDCSHEPAPRHSQAPPSPMSECPTGNRWRQALGAIGRRPVAWAVAAVVAGLALGAVLLVAIESTAGAIRKMAHVDAVELDLGWYRKFWALARVGVAVSLAAIAALVVHAAGWLAVAVTVSAPIDARRAQLLWLLGADDRGVRRAPVAAAALTAVAVAAVALVAARVGWLWLDRELGSVGQLYAAAFRLRWPAPAWLAAFVAGMSVAGGVIGSIRAPARVQAIPAADASCP